MNNVYYKLQSARVELQDMKLKMTGENKYSSFKYYELGDFLPAVNRLCLKYGLFTKFDIVSDKGVEKAILKVVNMDDDREQLSFILPTAEVEIGKKKDGTGGAEPIQNQGGKNTYMRRYMLMNAFEIIESDIVDAVKEKIITKELSTKELSKIEKAGDLEELSQVCKDLVEEKGDDYRQSVLRAYHQRKVQLNENS